MLMKGEKTFEFDAIRNRHIVSLIGLSVVLIPLFVLIVSHVEAFWYWMPELFYKNLNGTLLVTLIVAFLSVLLARYKRVLFWKKVKVVLDEEQTTLIINGQTFLLKDLEYYTYSHGAAFDAGKSRFCLFLKFEEEKELAIVPCRSSDNIKQYDDFFRDALELLSQKATDKKGKPVSAILKHVVMVLGYVILIGFLALIIISRDKELAMMFPEVLFICLMCFAFSLRRSKKGKKQAA